MTAPSDKALLPAGLADRLPPEAAQEANVVAALMSEIARHGYQRVGPPLVEFEENLLADAGADMAAHTFRIMDPVSQRMMGLRADMTMQVARIAATRLHKAPRPLRLCYAGDVLRVRGTQLRPERQFAQVGAELIGAGGAAADISADVEIVTLAAEGLASIGVHSFTVDLGAPDLVRAVFAAHRLDHRQPGPLRDALDHKDAAAVARLGGEAAPSLVALLGVAGPVEEAARKLSRLELPAAAKDHAERLIEIAGRLRAALPDLPLTLDAVENRGFDYHTSFGFTIFSDGVRGELGRGGRYVAGRDGPGDEPGTGVTLFMDTVLRALPEPEAPQSVYLPAGVPAAEGQRLRAEGWTTLAGLDAVADDAAEAGRLGCSHVLRDGKPVPVKE